MEMKDGLAIKWALLGIFILASSPIHAQNPEDLKYREYDEYVLTHLLTAFGPVPTALDPDGVYPYVSYCETSDRPVLKKYHFISIENEFLKIVICPDLGGKVTSILHKGSGKEVLYSPKVIRQTRILPRYSFIAGGIEVSFPISHTPVQNERVLFKVDWSPDRIYVTCGERELRYGMQWAVEYSLGKHDRVLTERVIYHNPGHSKYPWMSWSNAAIPASSDTRFDFPQGRVLVHSSKLDTITWSEQGPKTESGIKEMTGYFWLTKEATAFGVFTPSAGCGLYHIADKKISPGIKLWSYGVGPDSSWSVLSTERSQPYVEIQGGPLGDQSIRAELSPDETGWHLEYWIPTDKPLDILKLEIPEVRLRSVSDIPLFQWARTEDLQPWMDLMHAYQERTKPTNPPGIELNCWAPSGLESMDSAFRWAIRNTEDSSAELWAFYYGTWLAARGLTESAINTLSRNKLGIAKVLLARILKSTGRTREAAEFIRSVQEPWLQLHPQVVVERDKILRGLGPSALGERELWLSKVNALKDEWIIERRVQLLIDQGDIAKAKELLLGTNFQKIHQSYTRTGLWKQITDKLNIPFLPIPGSLGEDRLARFGAYREYE